MKVHRVELGATSIHILAEKVFRLFFQTGHGICFDPSEVRWCCREVRQWFFLLMTK